MSMNITVIKRDGEKEPFDETKISRVLHAAGLEESIAKDIAINTKKMFHNQNKNEVTSLEIRDAIIPQIKKADDAVASAFIWYEKTKE